MTDSKEASCTTADDEDMELKKKVIDEEANCTPTVDEYLELMKKNKQKIKLYKRGNSVKMNDKVIHYLITKDDENLSCNNIGGKIPVLLIFPLIFLMFLLLMIYL